MVTNSCRIITSQLISSQVSEMVQSPITVSPVLNMLARSVAEEHMASKDGGGGGQ